MGDFFHKLTDNFDAFTYSQKTVANYLIDNQDNVAFDTLEDLAEKIGVSTTTVIRFSRVLGYQGYSDMQKISRTTSAQKPLFQIVSTRLIYRYLKSASPAVFYQ